jgi:hypothetical protein
MARIEPRHQVVAAVEHVHGDIDIAALVRIAQAARPLERERQQRQSGG